MQNGWGHGMWKKAVRNGAAISIGVIISNITDPTLPIYSKAWFFHTFIAASTVFLVTELTYTKNWLTNGNGNGNGASK